VKALFIIFSSSSVFFLGRGVGGDAGQRGLLLPSEQILSLCGNLSPGCIVRLLDVKVFFSCLCV